MGVACGNCGKDYLCTGWDGKGTCTVISGKLNHNLVETCPKDETTCVYRKALMKSDAWPFKQAS